MALRGIVLARQEANIERERAENSDVRCILVITSTAPACPSHDWSRQGEGRESRLRMETTLRDTVHFYRVVIIDGASIFLGRRLPLAKGDLLGCLLGGDQGKLVNEI